jgi:hypothetical protein
MIISGGLASNTTNNKASNALRGAPWWAQALPCAAVGGVGGGEATRRPRDIRPDHCSTIQARRLR